jgi:hypothetical protein
MYYCDERLKYGYVSHKWRHVSLEEVVLPAELNAKDNLSMVVNLPAELYSLEPFKPVILGFLVCLADVIALLNA